MEFKRCLIITWLALASLGCSRQMNNWAREESYNGHDLERIVNRETRETSRETCSNTFSPAPVERSSNTGTDSSYLTTSLAWSTATWKNGKLKHEIGNHPEVPSRETTRDITREITVHDTLRLRDTVYLKNASIVEKMIDVPWLDKVWTFLGKVLSIVILASLAWRKLKSGWKL